MTPYHFTFLSLDFTSLLTSFILFYSILLIVTIYFSPFSDGKAKSKRGDGKGARKVPGSLPVEIDPLNPDDPIIREEMEEIEGQQPISKKG